tara:strand:+ start:444 stop:671 length:228 start_codon:yes stop_codon:yes gene_type:complete
MKPKKRKVTKGTFDMEVDGKSVPVKGKLVQRFDKEGNLVAEKFTAKGKDEIKRFKEKKKRRGNEVLVKKRTVKYK